MNDTEMNIKCQKVALELIANDIILEEKDIPKILKTFELIENLTKCIKGKYNDFSQKTKHLNGGAQAILIDTIIDCVFADKNINENYKKDIIKSINAKIIDRCV